MSVRITQSRNYIATSSPTILKKIYSILLGWLCYGGKEIIWLFRNTGTDWQFKGHKMSLGPTRVGAYGGQVTNAVLALVHFSVSPVGPGACPAVISAVYGCIIGKDLLNSCIIHFSPPTCGQGLLWWERVQWKTLELLPPRKIINSK